MSGLCAVRQRSNASMALAGGLRTHSLRRPAATAAHGMRLDLPLEHPTARTAAIGAVIGLCGSLLYVILCDFLVGALTDERIRMTTDAHPGSFITAPFTDDRVGVNPDVLAAVARHFPNSPRLRMRLGEFEKYKAEDDWRAAEFHAKRAIDLSPYDYRPRLLLSTIQENQDNLQAAEESVRAALKLAPGYLEAHWQLGALLLRKGNLAGSLVEFHEAASGHIAYLQAALKLIWIGSAE